MASASASPPAELFVNKDALRRIISDITHIRQHPLTAHGIYYEHDDTDLLKGRALIIGPADTPYAGGFYLFTFQFPPNYPHAPPKVDFCTGDGYTRFNPNLYRTGKVCLSILNTWKGEPWSGCQTISSVLLALCTILNAEPLLNEPGVTKAHRDFATYNAIIAYKNIEVAIFGMLARVYAATNDEFALFGDIMRESFQTNKDELRARILAGADGVEYSVGVYRMSITTHYKQLLEKFAEPYCLSALK
jgi:ubiquitin-protein ligase